METALARRWESMYPLLLGLGLFLLCWFTEFGESGYTDLLSKAAPTAISVAAILAGFQGTIHAILLAMQRSRAVRRLKMTGHYNRLIHFIAQGVTSLLLFVGVAIAVVTIEATESHPWALVPARMSNAANTLLGCLSLSASWEVFNVALLVGLFTYSMLSSFRVIRLILLMLKLEADTEHKDEGKT